MPKPVLELGLPAIPEHLADQKWLVSYIEDWILQGRLALNTDVSNFLVPTLDFEEFDRFFAMRDTAWAVHSLEMLLATPAYSGSSVDITAGPRDLTLAEQAAFRSDRYRANRNRRSIL